MRITDAFDGGNIIVQSADDPADIRLEIRRDNNSDFYQWFYFRLTGAKGQDCTLRIMNAGGAAYAKGWAGYNTAASYDRVTWFRVPASYDGQVLTIRHKPEQDSVYYAYFAPYSMERHADLVARALQDDWVSLTVLGQTLDGQDLDLLTLGSATPDAKRIWIIARQHPGETMAEWLMEGLIHRLLDRADPVSGKLLERCRFYLVPNMNPDGSRRGHLRTNAAGANLNREWLEPSLDKSPEVYLVRQAMHAQGLDFCLDVHGDEEMPYNYLILPVNVPAYPGRVQSLCQAYSAALAQASPDFQTEKSNTIAGSGKGDLRICSSYIAQTFNAPAMTLEMPFKDNDGRPDPVHGWSPARAKHLGRACLDALLAVLPNLVES